MRRRVIQITRMSPFPAFAWCARLSCGHETQKLGRMDQKTAVCEECTRAKPHPEALARALLAKTREKTS